MTQTAGTKPVGGDAAATAVGKAASATTAAKKPRPKLPGRQDWSSWPHYQAAAAGFRGYWYPVLFADQVGERPVRVRLLGDDILVIRDGDAIRAMDNRCPHRGVPLSYGNKQFPGTISCVYHGWTFDLENGELKAAITDGPTSPICGKVVQPVYPVQVRLGMVWIFVGDGEEPPPIDDQLPEELVDNPAALGVRIQPRAGNWRFACENGYDEGHAKYLHRTALWRLFKAMPVWNTTKIVKRGRWIYRVQEEQFWEAEFPGLGKWTGQRWYKVKPPKATTNIGNTASHRTVNPVIAGQEFPGFASVSMPGVLRIAYPTFVHYEFYVPNDADNHLYVGVLASFHKGVKTLPFYVKYLGAIRWLFHGQFSGQDRWMVEVTDAPPEKLYRPDDALLQWRKLAEDTTEDRIDDLAAKGVQVPDSTP